MSRLNDAWLSLDQLTLRGPQLESTWQIPGVNLPLSEAGYCFVALFICSIVHELGHAAAAIV